MRGTNIVGLDSGWLKAQAARGGATGAVWAGVDALPRTATNRTASKSTFFIFCPPYGQGISVPTRMPPLSWNRLQLPSTVSFQITPLIAESLRVISPCDRTAGAAAPEIALPLSANSINPPYPLYG